MQWNSVSNSLFVEKPLNQFPEEIRTEKIYNLVMQKHNKSSTFLSAISPISLIDIFIIQNFKTDPNIFWSLLKITFHTYLFSFILMSKLIINEDSVSYWIHILWANMAEINIFCYISQFNDENIHLCKLKIVFFFFLVRDCDLDFIFYFHSISFDIFSLLEQFKT
jgi:hypothetical protein